MIAVLGKVEQEALSLTRDERAFLADRLLSSLGSATLSDVDSAWVAEAERRYSDYQTGKREPIPADKVFNEADGLLG